MEYRITDVTGDSTTVHMTIITDNISDKDRVSMMHTYQIIDAQGHGYENSLTKDKFKMSI